MTKTIELKTKEKREIIDVTEEIEKFVSSTNILNGICLLNVPHATAAIYLNENEEGLTKDTLKILENLVPNDDYLHNRVDDNAQAHLLSLLIGTSVSLSIIDGRLSLGTWQRVLFVELDGPRTTRRVFVHVQGES